MPAVGIQGVVGGISLLNLVCLFSGSVLFYTFFYYRVATLTPSWYPSAIC